MHPFQAFIATQTHEVTVDGVGFRLRRLTMEALAEIGTSLLLVTQPARPEGAVALPSASQIRASQDVLRRAVVASVAEVSADGATWSPARVVYALPAGLTSEQAAAQGMILIGDLPPAMVQQLGSAAMTHATGGRAARDWLSSFRGADADPARPDGEEVREAAE